MGGRNGSLERIVDGLCHLLKKVNRNLDIGWENEDESQISRRRPLPQTLENDRLATEEKDIVTWFEYNCPDKRHRLVLT